MGTNFYKVKPLPRKVKDELIQAIESDNLEVNKYNNVRFFRNKSEWEEIDIPQTEIHIGKRSAGWKFLFDHNDWVYYPKNKEKFIEWLKNPETGIIKDEYGETYSFEDFWEDVMVTYNTPWIDGSERWDGESYYQAHKNDPGAHYSRGYDFYLEDLRFSTTTDFS